MLNLPLHTLYCVPVWEKENNGITKYQSDSNQDNRTQRILIFWGNSENCRWHENVNAFDSEEHNFKAWSFRKIEQISEE